MHSHTAADGSGTDQALAARLAALCDEGRAISRGFEADVRRHAWHPFVAADYGRVLEVLLALRAPGLRFLEWGSAPGVITIMADLLGYEAYGIELDADLVRVARELATRHHSRARFAAGSFLPGGYAWTSAAGDARLGTIGEGVPGYAELGHALDAFDVVFAYPWGGEEPMMHDVMRRHGGREARLLLYGVHEGIEVYRGGLRLN